MPAIGQFLDLLEAISRRDWKRVEEIGRRVAEEERKKKHYGAAHKLLEALEVVTSSSGFERVGTLASPTAQPTSAPPELLHSLSSEGMHIPPILPAALEKEIDEFIFEWQFEDRLQKKGLSPRRTVLLHGPPGCGKTLLAQHLAARLKMKLYVVRFDNLISSFLGETGQNIRKVFEFIGSNRCALLIDELDAIAKLRDDKNELGELKRVVISLLQNLDLSTSKSLLLAATNHPHMLDPAIWRRFEVVWEISAPTAEARVKLFSKFLEKNLNSPLEKILVEASEGLSGSDVAQICRNARRRQLIDETASLEELLLICLIEQLKRRTSSGETTGPQLDDKLMQLVILLRDMASEKYSFQELERLSGIPKSTLHHRIKSIGNA